jgi:outer membrane protein OmpA-like peptidoglycan-associated protein
MTSTNANKPAYALTALAISALTFGALAACTASASFGGADQPTAAPPPPPPPPPATTPAPTATDTAPPAPTATATTPPAPPRKSTVSVKSDTILVPGVIEFDEGTTTLKATSDAALEELRLFLEQNPRVTKLRIEGYTDNVGKAEDNENLSGMRALSIKKWLVNKGIAKDRLIAAGFGPKSPIADNATAEGRAKNRRIEFKLAELGGKKYLNRDLNGGGKVLDF